MNTLLFLPLSVCILTSCTLTEFQTKTPITSQESSLTEVSQNQETTVSSNVTNPTLIATILRDAYSEERLAEDIYTLMVGKYPQLSGVMNIIDSEEKHSVQVGRLLDARGIPRPTDYGGYASTFDTLSKMVDTNLEQAIEAGVMIEVGDIDHLLEEYRKIEDADVRRVFENIGGGSFNHLRAFLRLAAENNHLVVTDYSRYMSLDEIKTTGSLGYKMTDLLHANNLPTFSVWNGKNRN